MKSLQILFILLITNMSFAKLFSREKSNLIHLSKKKKQNLKNWLFKPQRQLKKSKLNKNLENKIRSLTDETLVLDPNHLETENQEPLIDTNDISLNIEDISQNIDGEQIDNLHPDEITDGHEHLLPDHEEIHTLDDLPIIHDTESETMILDDSLNQLSVHENDVNVTTPDNLTPEIQESLTSEINLINSTPIKDLNENTENHGNATDHLNSDVQENLESELNQMNSTPIKNLNENTQNHGQPTDHINSEVEENLENKLNQMNSTPIKDLNKLDNSHGPVVDNSHVHQNDDASKVKSDSPDWQNSHSNIPVTENTHHETVGNFSFKFAATFISSLILLMYL